VGPGGAGYGSTHARRCWWRGAGGARGEGGDARGAGAAWAQEELATAVHTLGAAGGEEQVGREVRGATHEERVPRGPLREPRSRPPCVSRLMSRPSTLRFSHLLFFPSRQSPSSQPRASASSLSAAAAAAICAHLAPRRTQERCIGQPQRWQGALARAGTRTRGTGWAGPV
jgi:hypothetical protein